MRRYPIYPRLHYNLISQPMKQVWFQERHDKFPQKSSRHQTDYLTERTRITPENLMRKDSGTTQSYSYQPS